MVQSVTSSRSNFISFILEPPSKVEFYNTTGVVIPCAAIGNPKPSIHWITLLDGLIVNQVDGLRHLRSDGSLIFTPFKESDYRQDVHFNIYRCIASNSLGAIGSRDVHVTSGMYSFTTLFYYKLSNYMPGSKGLVRPVDKRTCSRINGFTFNLS